MVLRNLHDGIVVMNATGELIYVNEAGARLGLPSAEEMWAARPGEARTRFQIFDVDGEPLPPERLPGRRALAGEEPEPIVVRFRAGPELPDRISEVRAVGVRDASGALQYAISFFREVTSEVARADEQRAAADQYAELYREAQRTTALLDALYGAAPVGLGFWDRDLRYVRVNEKLAEINELPAQDHVGRTFAEVVPQLADALEPMARQVLERREPVIALEVTAGSPSRPDEPRHWLASYYPVLAADGEALGVGCVIEEITDRRRAEQRTALQLAVTGILAVADATADAVPRVLETICETLDWDVACYWSTDPDHPPVTWARPGRRFDGFLAMTERAALSSAMLAGRVAASGEPEWLTEMNRSTFARASVASAEGLKSGRRVPGARRGRSGRRARSVLVGAPRRGRRADADADRDRGAARSVPPPQARRGGASAAAAARADRACRGRSSRLDAAQARPRLLRRHSSIRRSPTCSAPCSPASSRCSKRIPPRSCSSRTTASCTSGRPSGSTMEIERAVAIPIGSGMAGRVAALRTPLLAPDLSQIELVSPVLRERGINSLVAIPLIVEDRVIGVVHAGSVAFAQFVEDDARLLELIADRIAMAINQAALYEAERVAQERLQFLGEASTLLASSLDVDATLARVAQLAVPHFADWCSVDLLEPSGAIHRVAIEHVDREQVELAQRLVAAFPALARGRVRCRCGDQDRRGRAVGRDRRVRTARGVRQPPRVPRCAPEPWPDLDDRRPADRPRPNARRADVRVGGRPPYRASDLQFAQELAARAAVAVDNAHLYRAAERRRDRLAFLAEASALLGSSLDVDRTLERLGSLLAERFADWVAIHLARAEGPARLMTISHGDDEKKLAAEAELQAFASDREPPLLVARSPRLGNLGALGALAG